jgi:hypothetical protein
MTWLHCYCSYYFYCSYHMQTLSQQSTSTTFCFSHGMIMLSLDLKWFSSLPASALLLAHTLWTVRYCTACPYLMDSETYLLYISHKWGDIMLPVLFSWQEIVSLASVSTSQWTHSVSITETNRINVHRSYGEQGCTNFPKIWEPPQNSRCQMGDMKLVSHWGTTNIRCDHTQFGCHRNLAHRICSSLIWSVCNFCLILTKLK